MGGMGFIESNQSVLMFNNTMISFNVLEAARKAGVKRFFYASSACVYNELVQDTPENPGLKESDAWPAQPQDTYGLEKLYAEEMAKAYQRDFDIQTRIARFHNVYGPHGTWKGGREKAPAAFCRKAIASTGELEMWGDGKQTRSFIFIEDCVDGVLRLLFSDLAEPINLGSDELISMNDFATMIMQFRKDGPLPIKHLEGPLGVRGRNSNNDFIKEKLGWAPSIPVKVGIEKTYRWIESQIEREVAAGAKMTDYVSSKIVVQSTESLDKLNDAVPPTNGAYPSTTASTEQIASPWKSGARSIPCRSGKNHRVRRKIEPTGDDHQNDSFLSVIRVFSHFRVRNLDKHACSLLIRNILN